MKYYNIMTDNFVNCTFTHWQIDSTDKTTLAGHLKDSCGLGIKFQNNDVVFVFKVQILTMEYSLAYYKSRRC